MAITGTVTAKGQTTIPKKIRDELGLAEGTRIEWSVSGGKATVAARGRKITDLFGMLGTPPAGIGGTHEEIDEAVGQAIARHVTTGGDGA